MNFKKDAAKKAVSLIKNNQVIGLGDGSTIEFMVEFLKEEKYNDLALFTSSTSTKSVLEQFGFKVNDISTNDALDIYFDGCDQFDKNLHALKSGSGIHTTEKLFASMAKQFILVGDASKYVHALDTKFPVVVEVIPASVIFVQRRIKELFPHTKAGVRYKNNEPVVTRYSNHLLDIWFESFPGLYQINFQLKSITGVLETSLFYNLATKAIIAGEAGIQVLEKS